MKQEKLYNNIVLTDDYTSSPNNASDVPYLKEPPAVIDVSVGRQLFVDDFLIAETTLAPTYHKAVKRADPVMKPETDLEKAGLPVACPKSGGVWYDERERLYKMWYEAGWLRQMAYAVSRDGIEWERPDLGEKPGTNAILTYEGFRSDRLQADIAYFRPDSTTVWIDDTAPADERYKLFLRNPGADYPAIAAVSGDGIRFRSFTFTPPIDDRSTIFFNPFRKKWVYSIRSYWSGRSRLYRECDDYLTGAKWEPGEAVRWMCCDELDRPDPYIGFAPQLYNVDCVGYESLMLGMFQIMYGPENDVCERTGAPKITELIPMYSRDGYHFSRPDRTSLISASRVKGAWDRGYVQSVGGVTIIHGDELWIYYAGFGGDETQAGKVWYENGMYGGGATGLATLRRDGFVSMDGTGVLVTRPLIFHEKEQLHLNAKGFVKVAALSQGGTVLAEYLPFRGDKTDAVLETVSGSTSCLNGRPVRLRFEVKGELYAFTFTDENGEAGGAHAAGRAQP